MRRWAALLALVALAACGGGEREEYVRSADALCLAAEQAAGTAPAAVGAPAEVAHALRNLERINGDLVRGLRALEVPDGDEQLAGMLDAADRSVQALGWMATAADPVDPRAFSAATGAYAEAAAEAAAAARDAGLQVCGREP